jgi:hypothetical protein
MSASAAENGNSDRDHSSAKMIGEQKALGTFDIGEEPDSRASNCDEGLLSPPAVR